jgi:large subunit ribosomal protein L29
MKADELRAKTEADLKAQFNLRMQAGSGQQTRPSQIREARRDIARIKTILGQKLTGGA